MVDHGGGEGARLLEVGQVGGLRDDHERRAADGLLQAQGGRGGCDGVVGAGDHKRRGSDAVELGPQVHRRDRLAALRVALAVDAGQHGGHRLDDAWFGGREPLREPASKQGVAQRAHAIAAHECGTLMPRRWRGQVRGGAGQHQPVHAVGMVGRDPHRHHRPQRHAGEAGVLDAEVVEQLHRIATEIGDGEGAGPVGGATVPGVLVAHDAEALGQHR